ncbi:tryptophan--tRNA ligase [candidate division KSB1 bacterium]|nr:tryptophan--tRNA ligase [candidate division KSB1 bacterium]RQW00185.1 MAG: tryptophan--tRNA ligase [candidate division KSB1 bacterium]
MRVLSGIQPSGALHLGNYFAMMKRMIEFQKNHELFCFIVNYHALTTVKDADYLRKNTFEACIDFLALGIDPEKSYFYVQSDVPEVTELTWILSNITEMGLLKRAHSYKDKVSKGIEANHGLFAYPVLMAADILLYGANLVPVGRDQKQHVEMTRDIAIKFNHNFGEVFIVPEADIQDDLATIPGIDGQKMSKSYDNTIEIFAPKNVLKKKIMSIVTDAKSIDEPKDPKICNLFALYSLFLDQAGKQELTERYLTPGLRYGDIKKELLETIWNYFEPYREKRNNLLHDPDLVHDIMLEGARKTRLVAKGYLEKAREAVGLNY